MTQSQLFHTYCVDSNGNGLFIKKVAGNPSEVPIKFARVSIAGGTTDGNIVTAVTGKKIRVYKFELVCGSAGASTLIFNTKPAGAGVAIYGGIDLIASQNEFRPFDPFGYFETVVGEGLTGTTGANTVKVMIGYIEIG